MIVQKWYLVKTACIYVSVVRVQKRATLGAVFGVPSTAPNPGAWPLQPFFSHSLSRPFQECQRHSQRGRSEKGSQSNDRRLAKGWQTVVRNYQALRLWNSAVYSERIDRRK